MVPQIQLLADGLRSRAGGQKSNRSPKRSREIGVALMQSGQRGSGGGSALEMMGNLAQVWGGSRMMDRADRAEQDRMKAIGTALQNRDSAALYGMGDPNAMQLGLQLEKMAQEQRKGADLFEPTQKLRKEVTARPEFKTYSDVSRQYKNLSTSAQQESGAGDIGVIFSYMKMLDPQSVVREGEQATAQNAAGVSARIRNLYNEALSGSKLSPEARQQIVDAAHGLYTNAHGAYSDVTGFYEPIARSEGIDPSMVYTSPELMEKPVLAPPVPAAPAVPEQEDPEVDDLLRRYGGAGGRT